MTKYQAAVLLVEMISDLRVNGYDREEYHEAVALACKELIARYEQEES